jgi:transcriptional regulator with XRE-family HTH domain
LLRLKRLKEARELAGLSQDELATASRTARATVADLELNKRTAQPRTARRLAEALGVQIRDLVEEAVGKVLAR